MSNINEKLFEDFIADYLVEHGGYRSARTDKPSGPDFDPVPGLDTPNSSASSKKTQPNAWAALVKVHGGSEATARTKFLNRLTKRIDEEGVLNVLRHGVRDQNVEIKLAYFKPAHRLTPELMERYEKNRLDADPSAPVRPGIEQDARPLHLRQRHSCCHCGAQEPADRPDHRACDHAVPRRPGPSQRHSLAALSSTSQSTPTE